MRLRQGDRPAHGGSSGRQCAVGVGVRDLVEEGRLVLEPGIERDLFTSPVRARGSYFEPTSSGVEDSVPAAEGLKVSRDGVTTRSCPVDPASLTAHVRTQIWSPACSAENRPILSCGTRVCGPSAVSPQAIRSEAVALGLCRHLGIVTNGPFTFLFGHAAGRAPDWRCVRAAFATTPGSRLASAPLSAASRRAISEPEKRDAVLRPHGPRVHDGDPHDRDIRVLAPTVRHVALEH